MTMILDDSMVTRAESDYAKITQISAIGSLADAVLRELIVIEAGAAQVPLVGIPMAAKIFREASADLDRPRNIWDVRSPAHELLHFTGGGTARPTPGAPRSDDVRTWFDQIAEALESAASSTPSADSIALAREEFTKISNETMRSAAHLASTRYLLA